MSLNRDDESTLRHYLLGQLSQDDQQAFEQQLMVDDGAFETLMAIEDELVDEYLNGELSGQDRTSFETHFLATPERQEKLRFGGSFKKFVSAHDEQKSFAPRRVKKAPTLWSWMTPVLSSPLRVAAGILIVTTER